ncbi:tetratricopeptide repeat protein [Anaerosporobacter sp.]|uniref:tetratricopeptide repeat protein n=1 Tax=Anaerosporobacter sp. TaxID=1872529 RepID=UPI00286F10E2|nr:tetratricopeptide repeat protein [Anaerosporobacter sp.]
MNCPNCGSALGKKSKCDKCGIDVSAIQKAIRISNSCYNLGLEKAKVRDLSGAVFVLQKSLKFNKENTNARNLLGLVYYEMGEIVAALSEWVISKHYKPNDNDCDYYINSIQSNQTRLESANQTIKKYNAALQSAKQGNDDLAIIQLKKVTSMNPHFLRAHHLLALLYMKNSEKEKALKCLTKIRKIDITNTTTLRYLDELKVGQQVQESSDRRVENNVTKTSNVSNIAPISNYREEKPNIWVFLNLIIGIIIGVGLLYFLVVPNVKKQAASDSNAKIVDLNSQIAVNNREVTSLQSDNEKLQETIDSMQKQMDDLNKESEKFDEALYDKLFNAIKAYIENENEDEVVQTLLDLDMSKIDRKAAVDVYDLMKQKTFNGAATSIYEQGHTLFSKRKYEEAIDVLKQVVEINEDKVVDALYFIGRSYQMLSDNDNAVKYYNQVVEDYPDSARVAQAKSRLSEIQ